MNFIKKLNHKVVIYEPIIDNEVEAYWLLNSIGYWHLFTFESHSYIMSFQQLLEVKSVSLREYNEYNSKRDRNGNGLHSNN